MNYPHMSDLGNANKFAHVPRENSYETPMMPFRFTGNAEDDEWGSAHIIKKTIGLMVKYFYPVVSNISLVLNIVCLLILIKPIFKGSLYRYLLFNTVFDSITLITIIIKPFCVSALSHSDSFQLYVFIYTTSISVTCSNLTKIAISADRLSKMTGRMRWLCKRSHRLFIFLIISVSIFANSPLIYRYDILEYKVYKQTYFELVSLNFGHEFIYTIMDLFTFLIFDLGVFLMIIYLNKKLHLASKSNMTKLVQLIENEKYKTGEYVINIMEEGEEENEDDEIYDDEAIRADMEKCPLKNENQMVMKNRHKCSKHMHEIDLEKALDQNRYKHNNQSRLCQKKKNPIDIEAARRKLCKLVVLNSYVYFAGHSLLLACNLFRHVFYLNKGSLKDGVEYGYLDFLSALANLILSASYGLNLFVFFIFNQRFKYVIKKALSGFFGCCCCGAFEMYESNYSSKSYYEDI